MCEALTLVSEMKNKDLKTCIIWPLLKVSEKETRFVAQHQWYLFLLCLFCRRLNTPWLRQTLLPQVYSHPFSDVAVDLHQAVHCLVTHLRMSQWRVLLTLCAHFLFCVLLHKPFTAPVWWACETETCVSNKSVFKLETLLFLKVMVKHCKTITAAHMSVLGWWRGSSWARLPVLNRKCDSGDDRPLQLLRRRRRTTAASLRLNCLTIASQLWY